MKYIPYTKIKKFRDGNTPDQCPIFECKLDDAVLDHNHDSGMVRGVLHRQSNSWLGKIENSWKRFGAKSNVNLSKALKNVCNYLDKGDLPYLHPRGAKQVLSRFSRECKEEQIRMMKEIKCTSEQINCCNSSEERALLYRTFLIQNKYK